MIEKDKFFTASIRLCLSYGCLFFLCAWQLKEDIFSLISNDSCFLSIDFFLDPSGAPLGAAWQLSTDSEEELKSEPQQSIEIVRKKKPTIVDNTNKKESSRKRSRKQPTVSFMDTFQDESEDQVEKKRTRSDSRSLSKYEQLREKILLKRRKQRMRYLRNFYLF